MATARVLLKKAYQSKDESYPLIIRLQDNNKLIDYNTGYKLKENQFINGEG